MDRERASLGGTRLLPYGPTAWLLEGEDLDVVAAADAVARLDGVAEVIPAERTVLVLLDSAGDREVIGRQVGEVAAAAPSSAARRDDAPTVEIVVVYDGEDLDAVANACDMTAADVIERHTTARYRCAFCGFVPGFAYLTGLDPALHLPRRTTPRTRVPAGSVAIAAGYSAVYPTASPGGWHLLGRTDTVLFDPSRPDPALITPGTTVRFTVGRP